MCFSQACIFQLSSAMKTISSHVDSMHALDNNDSTELRTSYPSKVTFTFTKVWLGHNAFKGQGIFKKKLKANYLPEKKKPCLLVHSHHRVQAVQAPYTYEVRRYNSNPKSSYVYITLQTTPRCQRQNVYSTLYCMNSGLRFHCMKY